MQTLEKKQPVGNYIGRLLRLLKVVDYVRGPYRRIRWSHNLQKPIYHPGWTFCDFRNSHLFHAVDYGEILKYIADHDLEEGDFEVHAIGNAYYPQVQLTVRHFHKDQI